MGFYLNDYFVAKGISLRRRFSELFDELEKNPELSQAFMRNPTLIIKTKVLPELPDIQEDSITAANQLLYSVLSNDKFLAWAKDYGNKLVENYNKTGKLPSKKSILQAFAKGIIDFGDPNIVSSILEIPQASDKQASGLVEHWWYFYHIIIWAEFFYIFIYDYIIVFPAAANLLDQKEGAVSFSTKELKSLVDQMVKYSKKMRAERDEVEANKE